MSFRSKAGSRTFLLASLIGWYAETDREKWPISVQEADVGAICWWRVDDGWYLFMPDLYDEHNMNLAWKCHLWALNDPDIRGEYERWWRHGDVREVWFEDNAQELWLNKIVELARRKKSI